MEILISFYLYEVANLKQYFLDIYIFCCAAYYLAEESIDCEDTCKQLNESYACFNRVNTHESYAIFESTRDPTNHTRELEITCDGASTDPTTSTYSKTLHPSYDTATGRCDGYIMAPLKINCTANETIDEQTRRLCYCVDIGKSVMIIVHDIFKST